MGPTDVSTGEVRGASAVRSAGGTPPAATVTPESPPHHAVGFASRATTTWRAIRLPFWIATSRIAIGMVFAHLVVTLLPTAFIHLPNGALNNGTWFGTFDRWDSAYYTFLSIHWYPHHYAPFAAFFPGYPLAIRLTHDVSFAALTSLQASMITSWICFIGASILLYRLACQHFDERVALIATGLFCWVPASFFFLAPYSEALLVLEIVAVATLIDRKWFLAASLVAAYASATSPREISLSAVIVIAALLARRGILRTIGYLAVSCAGLIAYAGYLWAVYGSPLEFGTVQKLWDRTETFPFVGLFGNFVALHDFFKGPGPSSGGTVPTFSNVKYAWVFDDVSLICATGLTVVLVVTAARPLLDRRSGRSKHAARTDHVSIPSSFVTISVGVVLTAASTSIYPFGSNFYSTDSEARFVSVAFPLYIVAAALMRRRTGLAVWVLGFSVAGALLFQALFNLGYWIT